MLRLFKHVVVALTFVLIAGCSGGGCASGCSCAGVTPLAEGFPTEQRIENVASVRLTDSGIGFLEQNLGTLAGTLLGTGMGGGALTFEIPSFSQNIVVANAEICKDGPMPNGMPPECLAEIDLANAQLQIDPQNPHNLVISGPMPIRIQKLPVRVTWLGIFNDDLDIVLNDGGTCPGDGKPYKNIGINEVNISIEIDADQSHSRYGYSRIRIGNIDINENDILDGIAYCGQGSVTGAILNALDGLLIGLIEGLLVDTLKQQLEDALCQQANPALNPTCPTGTFDVNGVCRFGMADTDECASTILGMDGNIDLGGFLASFSPGTTGGFDFLFASGGHNLRDDASGFAWGDLNPIGQGVTLGFYGGTEPTPLSGCVTPAQIQLPSGISIPDELLANTVAGWPAMLAGPHFGLALSERFLNYAFAQLYNSGALCLGITANALGDAVPLTTSLIGIGLGASSMTELGRQKQGSEIAIILRPSEPPTVEVGNGTDIATDPNLRIEFNRVSFDFYVWSLDRFIRAFTATMDIDVPMNLIVTPEGLSPVIEALGVSNATVTNSMLIREDPAKIAAALQGLLGDLVGGFLGDALPPIDLNGQLTSLGISLDIPPTVEGQGSPGLRKLTKGTDDYLGIFATLGIAMPMNATAAPIERSETQAALSELSLDPNALALSTWSEASPPVATLHVGSNLDDGSRGVEWQYKLDKGPWHPFTQSRWLTVDDHWLRVQGKHTVFVRSRIVGDVHSLDPTPAEVTVIIDDAAPKVRIIENEDGTIAVSASDLVSNDDAVQLRVRFGDGQAFAPWSAWQKQSALAPLVAPDLSGRDAAEIEVEAIDEDGHVGVARSFIIRGNGDGTGCQCELSAGRSDAPAGAWWLAAALGLVLGWRRRRPSFVGAPGSAAFKRAGAALCLMLIGGLSGCSCGADDSKPPADDCRARGDCSVLHPGLIGSYTSAAVTADGTVWVAGYLEGSWLEELSYGDLVVGRLEDGNVAWKVVDGLPADFEVDTQTYDPKGFRGGVTDAGDDVGLWTSIAIDAAGNPAVAYFDAGNKALKYASLTAGAWAVQTVQKTEGGEVGRYAKLLFVDGQATIAYNFIEPGQNGAIQSGVRVATGAGSSWSYEDVGTEPNSQCSAGLCGPGYACVSSTRLCARTESGCMPACDALECVDIGGQLACEAIVPSTATETYPRALGLYISMDVGPSGLGLAYYDRLGGNVYVASKSGGAWTPILVDGSAGGADTGDKGIGLSLDIDDQGNYHLAYVNGLSEALEYVLVTDGTTAGTPETVDDGLGFGDGTHLVGDDADIVVTQGGEIHISYQDATAGVLRHAVGTPSGGGHNWTATTVSQEGFAGAFSIQVEVGGTRQILNWWRVASPYAESNVRLVQP